MTTTMRTGRLASGIPIVEVDANTYRRLKNQAAGTIVKHPKLLNTVRWIPKQSQDRLPHSPLDTLHPS
jgi:hypothetical protein